MMASNLDELERLRELDKDGMLENLGRFPEDCRLAIKRAKDVPLADLAGRVFKAMVFAGVGGSAIGGRLIKDWLSAESEIPIEVSGG